MVFPFASPELCNVHRIERFEECFYCGSAVDTHEMFIEWLGSSTEVFFHPPCALAFSIRLMRDVHEADCRGQTPLVNMPRPYDRAVQKICSSPR